MRKFLDGFEEAKPQILLGDVAQQFAKQRLVVRPDGTRKHAPTIPEDEMPLPLNRIRTHGHDCRSSASRSLVRRPALPGQGRQRETNSSIASADWRRVKRTSEGTGIACPNGERVPSIWLHGLSPPRCW